MRISTKGFKNKKMSKSKHVLYLIRVEIKKDQTPCQSKTRAHFFFDIQKVELVKLRNKNSIKENIF